MNIRAATAQDAAQIAALAGELLGEIMDAVGAPVFNFDLAATGERLREFIGEEKYFVFGAWDGDVPVGFIALYESYALYAEGAFGTIPELYVRPGYRCRELGFHLVEQAKVFGRSRGWKRLEVTTPPLPQFDKTLAFYEREGFAITGGRKLKVAL